MTSSRLARISAIGAGVAAAIAICAAPAVAATTYTVTAGSAATGTVVPITGTTQGASPQITFKDVTSSQTLTCASGSEPGTTTVASGVSGTAIGKITGSKSVFTGCSGPLGLTFKVTGVNTWKLNATSFNKSTGVAKGTITGIVAKVSDQGACVFTAKGTVAVTYKNSTTVLTAPGTAAQLTVSGVYRVLRHHQQRRQGVLQGGLPAAGQQRGLQPGQDQESLTRID